MSVTSSLQALLLCFGLTASAGFLLPHFTATASAETILVPRKHLGSYLFGRSIGQGLRDAMQAAGELARSKEALSAQIAAARRTFWETYPDGAAREAAEQEFARLLFAKDFAHLVFLLPEGPRSQRSQLFSAIGGSIDGGIPREAQAAYNDWVVALRAFLGAHGDQMVVFSPQQLLRALEDETVQNRYDAYKVARDRAEFDAAGHLRDFEVMRVAGLGPDRRRDMVKAACAASFADAAFCACAAENIERLNLAADPWLTISADFREVVALSRDTPSIKEAVRACYQ